jgi:hypothetical protein
MLNTASEVICKNKVDIFVISDSCHLFFKEGKEVEAGHVVNSLFDSFSFCRQIQFDVNNRDKFVKSRNEKIQTN